MALVQSRCGSRHRVRDQTRPCALCLAPLPWRHFCPEVYGYAYTAVSLDIQAQTIPITASSTEGRGRASQGRPLLHSAWSAMVRVRPWYAFCPVCEGTSREGGLPRNAAPRRMRDATSLLQSACTALELERPHLERFPPRNHQPDPRVWPTAPCCQTRLYRPPSYRKSV